MSSKEARLPLDALADGSQTGSIIDYLLDQYDKEGKLHFLDFPKKYEQRSWEHFQMSGQGP
jgi:glutathione S-transferase